MDSEDEMQDAWAGTSDGEFDLHNEDEDEESDALVSDDENDESDYGFDYSNADNLLPSSRLPQTNFTVLSEKDIRQRQEEAVATITNFLSVSPVDAGVLLRHFKWSVSKVNDEWFADEERVRATVGLLEKPATSKRQNQKEMTCEICFEVHPFEKMRAPRCGHYFCETCWTGQVKWCPVPNCKYAVEYQVGVGSYDLTCKCGYNFFWNYREELWIVRLSISGY